MNFKKAMNIPEYNEIIPSDLINHFNKKRIINNNEKVKNIGRFVNKIS